MRKISLRIIVFSCIAFGGCGPSNEVSKKERPQTEKEAVEIMCSLPSDVSRDPAKIGAYLDSRITNLEIRKLLATLADPKGLDEILRRHGGSPDTCALMKAFRK